MQKHLIKTIIILLCAFLAACSTAIDPSEAYRGESSQQIYLRGKEALRSKDYAEAIKRFEALDVQYPFGPETESAQFYLIYTYYMHEDYVLAVASADRFIRNHPTNPHLDYIYYIRGMADFYQNLGILERVFSVDLSTRDLSQIRKSYMDFNELIIRFPNSPYAPSAYRYMIYLRNMLADHELGVANYYYNRRAYVASANRASGLVAYYQGAPSVVPALMMMAKSYRALGLTKLEQDTMAVLNYNYPGITVS